MPKKAMYVDCLQMLAQGRLKADSLTVTRGYLPSYAMLSRYELDTSQSQSYTHTARP